LETNNVQLIYPAKIPTRPVKPRRTRAVAVSTLFGVLLGYGLALLREIFSKTIRSRQEFERILEIPFLGHVPAIELPKRHRGRESLLLLTQPQSNTAESLRAIRTTLEFMLPAGQSHTLLLTSSVPAEGKSFMSLNLAVVLQELGRKVLLIDADMRRPSIHQLLNLPLEPGLSGYLQAQASLEEIVQMTDAPLSLPVIPAGLTPPQPPDLLAQPRMRELLERFKQEYTYVLIDTPPVLAVADTSILAREVGGVLYVVWSGRTHRDVALAGKARLLDVGARILGGILNGGHPEMERGYGYYYYYYQKKRKRPSRGPLAGSEPPAESEPPRAPLESGSV
jgi:capsular exopolysaccharide synthesis family protein